MCGRYTLIKLSDFTDMFPWIRAPDESATGAGGRYNIAPSQPIAVVPNDGNNQVEFFRWGFVPFWAKDVSIGNRMVNARVETLAEKPVFRNALKRRRCIIPASGFYEWKKLGPKGQTKQPMYIRMRDARPFAFAGLWEIWRAPDGSELPTCTIITGPPNALLASIHNRMPAILKPEDVRKWLEPGEADPEALRGLLTPYPAEQMEAIPVGRKVNNPAAEGPECIEPLTAESPPQPDPAQAPSPLTRGKSPRNSAADAADQPTLF